MEAEIELSTHTVDGLARNDTITLRIGGSEQAANRARRWYWLLRLYMRLAGVRGTYNVRMRAEGPPYPDGPWRLDPRNPLAPEPERGAGTQASESSAWPRTYQEAVDRVLQEMPDTGKTAMKATAWDDLILYHHGLGTTIRNEFGLWLGNDALLDDCLRQKPGTERHPDEASQIIIKGVWKRLQEPGREAG